MDFQKAGSSAGIEDAAPAVADNLIRHSMVEVNGAQLHVARAGQGRPLLLLHGWPEFWCTWHPIMVRLADCFELIAPDLRGFGDSAKPTGDFGPEEQASDIAELIKTLDVGPVGVVSHHVGASVAQVLARKHPEQVAGLFFFNFVYPGIGDRFYQPAHLNFVWHTFFNQSELAAPLLQKLARSHRAVHQILHQAVGTSPGSLR